MPRLSPIIQQDRGRPQAERNEFKTDFQSVSQNPVVLLLFSSSSTSCRNQAARNQAIKLEADHPQNPAALMC